MPVPTKGNDLHALLCPFKPSEITAAEELLLNAGIYPFQDFINFIQEQMKLNVINFANIDLVGCVFEFLLVTVSAEILAAIGQDPRSESAIRVAYNSLKSKYLQGEKALEISLKVDQENRSDLLSWFIDTLSNN